MEKIKIPQIDTANFKMNKGSDINITLHDNYLEYFAWSENETLNLETDVWEEKRYYTKYNINKERIESFDLVYLNSEELFEVLVYFAGKCFGIQFKHKDDANAILKRLTDWMWNK
jgi:hypothetical protein